MPFRIKRVYEAAAPADGERILVDRLWPRGVSKEKAALSGWEKAVAPSNELRQWFGHQPQRFEEFTDRYRKELESEPEKQQAVQALLQTGRAQTVTLLYGARDPALNQAAVLLDYLVEKGGKRAE